MLINLRHFCSRLCLKAVWSRCFSNILLTLETVFGRRWVAWQRILRFCAHSSHGCSPIIFFYLFYMFPHEASRVICQEMFLWLFFFLWDTRKRCVTSSSFSVQPRRLVSLLRSALILRKLFSFRFAYKKLLHYFISKPLSNFQTRPASLLCCLLYYYDTSVCTLTTHTDYTVVSFNFTVKQCFISLFCRNFVLSVHYFFN